MTDLRLALRLCLRHPLLYLAAIASLALGIGANTAIFTVLNGSVLRPLPYSEPADLMVVWETRADNPKRAVAPANFLDWRRETTAFNGLAAFDDFTATLTGAGEAQRIHAVSASGNFFAVLGVQAQLGRVMTADDDRADAPKVAVLTDGLWHQLYGGAADALGKTITLNGMAHTIVGVLPPSFDMPMVAGGEVWMTGDRGIPRSFPFAGDVTAVRDSHIIAVVGRLAAGARREQAQAQLTSVMTSLSQQYPTTNAGLGASVVPLHEEIVGNVRPLIVLLQIAVAVLLLIACANVAHLLLGQAATRQAEIAMRYALGADRARIVRQLLIETLMIAVPGGVAGLAVAIAGVRALVLVAPQNLPRLSELTVDTTVLAFSIVMTLLTAIVFGLGPAMQTARTSANDLGRIGQRVAGHRGVRRGHQALVIGELALAQALLVGAGLLLVSFVHATQLDLGFAQHDRVFAEINLGPAYVQPIGTDGLIDPSRKIRFINGVIDRVRGGQGVRAVAASSTAPLTGAPNRGMSIEGDPVLPPDQQPNADFQLITPDYFRAVGVTLVAGRSFTADDRADAPPVLVVNQALVDKYFAGRDPIGRVILFGGSKRHQIVGVVANARYRFVEQAADPTFYLPLEQNDERWPFLALTIWTDGSEAATSAASAQLRAAVREADPQQPISRLRTVEEILSSALAARRFNTWIVGLFAATALLLAAIGTYGVMAFAVSSRTRELGIRSALGATPADLIKMVLGQGLLLTMVASAIGLIAALALTRFMASMLFNVAPRDPITFALVAGILALIAIAATLIPARRAMAVNPTVALKDS
ncbi:MAG TPA: ABC transporter permease [Vicinamibacterales bacterium]|nr:ABC transporter permease [Vicinamibacterales bacterium]